jgi:DNA-binding XRE family transcriptional regulator
MRADQSQYQTNRKEDSALETRKRRKKIPLALSDDERSRLKLISEKARKMREEKDISYEQFAIQTGINRNSYYRFEKSAVTGDNYTVALLLKVITGLGTTIPEFFEDIK